MPSRLAFDLPLAGGFAALLLAVLPTTGAAQAVPTYPGDTIIARTAPPHPVYVSPGPIAPTLPGDTLLGNPLSADAAVPLHPIAPTMPGDVITQRPQWVLDTLRADSLRKGLTAPPDGAHPDSLSPTDSLAPADSVAPPDTSEPGFRVLPDARERSDSLRAEPQTAPLKNRQHPRPHRRDDGIRRS